MSNVSYNNLKLEEVAELMKLLSSEARLKIINLLTVNKDGLCVSELAKAVSLSKSATSHQLSKLESRGIVNCSREGQKMCYRLAKTKSAEALRCVLNNLK